MKELATLLEGAGYFFNISKVNSQTFILLWCKKCEKLEKEVILVINGVSTTYLWRKNEEKGPILSVFSVFSMN